MIERTKTAFLTLHKRHQGIFPKEPSRQQAAQGKGLLLPSRPQCISKQYLAKIAAESEFGNSQGKCHYVDEPATASLAQGSINSVWIPLLGAERSSMSKHIVEVLCSREQRSSTERTPKLAEYKAWCSDTRLTYMISYYACKLPQNIPFG